jgi:hypothetical protein
MSHARDRSTQGRSLGAAIALGALAFALAACAGTAAAPPSPPATTEPSVTPAPATSASMATPLPTGQLVVVTPAPAPAVFESPAYGYTIDLPARAEVTGVVSATAPWDGASVIQADGPMVDQFPRIGQRLAFILSAPTDLDLDAYAAAIHAKAVREHGCSEELAATRDVEVDGTPARIVASTCQGLHVYEATMVRDGIGLIAKQITPPPGSPALEKESLEDFMWFLEPLTWDR